MKIQHKLQGTKFYIDDIPCIYRDNEGDQMVCMINHLVLGKFIYFNLPERWQINESKKFICQWIDFFPQNGFCSYIVPKIMKYARNKKPEILEWNMRPFNEFAPSKIIT